MENSDCIFCKMVKREIPVHKIYENEKFLAFLDTSPETPGHTQVIPKKHFRWVWDCPDAGEYFEIVKKVALAQQKAFNTNWILSRIIGEEVQHAHIWVYPNSSVEGDKTDFITNAEKIRQVIGTE